MTFAGPWASNTPQMIVTAAGLSTTSATITDVISSGTLVAAGAALEVQSTTATQTVTINATSGAFNLDVPGAQPHRICHSMPPPRKYKRRSERSVRPISSAGGSVSVTATMSIIAGATNNVYTITFGGSMAASAEPQIVGASSTVNPLAGGLAGVAPNVDVQLVTVNEPAGSTAGTFAISFNGQTTTSLPYNATPAQVTTALESLPNVGTGTVTVNEAAGGTFTLSFEGVTTTALAYNATPATVQAALQTVLNNLLLNTTSITVGGINSEYIIAFSGTLLGSPITSLSAAGSNATPVLAPNNNLSVTGFPGAYEISYGNPFSSSSLALPAIVVQPANGATTAELPAGTYSDDIQLLTVNEVPGTTSGTYTLSFAGQTTSSLAYNSTAAQVQAALQALSSIGANNVLVSGSSSALDIVFVGAFAGQGSAIPSIGAAGTLAPQHRSCKPPPITRSRC